jgi:hypothetical protein
MDTADDVIEGMRLPQPGHGLNPAFRRQGLGLEPDQQFYLLGSRLAQFEGTLDVTLECRGGYCA